MRGVIAFIFYMLLLWGSALLVFGVKRFSFDSPLLLFVIMLAVGFALALIVKRWGRGVLLLAIPLAVVLAHLSAERLWPPAESDSPAHVFRILPGTGVGSSLQSAHPDNPGALPRPLSEFPHFTCQIRSLPLEEAEKNSASALDVKLWSGIDMLPVACGLQGMGDVLITAESGSELMFASLPEAGLVYCLERQNTPDKNGAEVKTAPNLWSRRIFCSDLDRPMGLAAHDGYLYVATRTGVVKLPIPESFTQKTGSIETFVTDLPPAYASEYRPLSIAPDGSAYLSVGAGDAGPQRSEWQRAGVLRIAPDGNTELYATGLHDVRALIHHPLTKALWALENSPETLDLHPPPDEINIVREGGDYGWPFCYGIKVPDKDLGTTTICAATDAPVALFPPYSNPTGLAFGTHLDAPKRYRSMLYVALQGQDDGTHLNRFRIVGLPLNENGALSGLGVDMLSALAPSAHRAARPAALCASPSGNLYLGDTCSGVVYRFIFPSDADHHLDLPRGENTSANNGQDTNTEKDRN